MSYAMGHVWDPCSSDHDSGLRLTTMFDLFYSHLLAKVAGMNQ